MDSSPKSAGSESSRKIKRVRQRRILVHQRWIRVYRQRIRVYPTLSAHDHPSLLVPPPSLRLRPDENCHNTSTLSCSPPPGLASLHPVSPPPTRSRLRVYQRRIRVYQRWIQVQKVQDPRLAAGSTESVNAGIGQILVHQRWILVYLRRIRVYRRRDPSLSAQGHPSLSLPIPKPITFSVGLPPTSILLKIKTLSQSISAITLLGPTFENATTLI